jgi:hypothetical protein
MVYQMHEPPLWLESPDVNVTAAELCEEPASNGCGMEFKPDSK